MHEVPTVEGLNGVWSPSRSASGGGEGENRAKSRSKVRWKWSELRHHHHQRSLFSQAQVALLRLLNKVRIMSALLVPKENKIVDFKYVYLDIIFISS